MRSPSAAGLASFLLVIASAPALAQAPGVASLNPLADIPPEAVSAFTEQPLFSESRRPVTRLVMPTLVESTPPVAAAPTTDDLRLVGTIQTSRGTLARIRSEATGDAQAVRSGEAVGGWTVTDISPAAVRLRQGEHVASLELFVAGSSSALASTPPDQSPTADSALPEPATASSTPPRAVRIVPMAPSSSNAAPAGTVPGTAAAEAATNSPYELTFGGTPQPQPQPRP